MAATAGEAAVPLDVFLMVLLSTFMHASWNTCARKVKGNVGVLT